ncbi:hypothetical protein GCM10009077_08140 [Roseibium denhamense]
MCHYSYSCGKVGSVPVFPSGFRTVSGGPPLNERLNRELAFIHGHQAGAYGNAQTWHTCQPG